MNEKHTDFIPLSDVAIRFGESVSRVRRLIEDRHLGAKRVGSELMVPAAFIRDDAPVPGVRGTLILLEDLGFSNDEAIDWLLENNDELGETPAEALRRGHKAPVRRAVQMIA